MPRKGFISRSSTGESHTPWKVEKSFSRRLRDVVFGSNAQSYDPITYLLKDPAAQTNCSRFGDDEIKYYGIISSLFGPFHVRTAFTVDNVWIFRDDTEHGAVKSEPPECFGGTSAPNII